MSRSWSADAILAALSSGTGRARPGEAAEPAAPEAAPRAHPLRSLGNRGVERVANAHGIQRKCACGGSCPECRAAEEVRKAGVQRKTGGGTAPAAAAVKEAAEDASGGVPLDPVTLRQMEARFKADFDDVRVHTDARADRLARGLGARAFTRGRHIYFASGQYRPGTEDGRKLLAHELAHVIQQRGGAAVQRMAVDGGVGDRLEREADAAAEAVVGGRAARVDGGAAAPRLQRTEGGLPPAGAGPIIPAPPDFRLVIPGEKMAPVRGDAEWLLGIYRTAAARRAVRTLSGGRRASVLDSWRASRPNHRDHPPPADCTADHLWELQLGGPDHPNNYRLLSAARNNRAGDKMRTQLDALVVAVERQQRGTRYVREHAQTTRTARVDVNRSGTVVQETRRFQPIVEFAESQISGEPPATPIDPCQQWELEHGQFTPTMRAATRPTDRAGPVPGQRSVVVLVAGVPVRIGFGAVENGLARVEDHSRFGIPGFDLQRVRPPATREGAVSAVEGAYLFHGVARAMTPPIRVVPGAAYTFTATPGAAVRIVEPDANVRLYFPFLSEAVLPVTFQDGRPVIRGSFRPSLPILRNVDVNLAIENGMLGGGASVPPEALRRALPVPGLAVDDVNLQLAIARSRLQAEGGFAVRFGSVASGRVEARVGAGGFEASGTLDLHLPGIDQARGRVWVREGRLGGEVTVGADQVRIPGVRSAGMTVRIEDGRLTGDGRLVLSVPGLREGTIRFAATPNGQYELEGSLGLDVPGLRGGRVTVRVRQGRLEGDGEVPIDSERLPGLNGNVRVTYRDGRLGGETTIAYRRGELGGSVTVRLDQLENGALGISGGGEVQARLAPWLTGRVRVDITREAQVNVAGEIRAPEEIELFPRRELRRERTFPRVSIPLWGFTVPVIDSTVGIVAFIEGGAGVTAFVGPGVLRNVGVQGTFSTQEGQRPSFDVSGQFAMAAGAEAYLFVGGGVSLGAAIADVSGSIRMRGSLGALASLGVTPHIGYRDGEYYFRGEMEMQALAFLRFSGAAHAGVSIPLYGEVWGQDWPLFDWVYPLGLNVGMRGRMEYVFGRPFNPTFEIQTSELDPMAVVRAAVPGPGQRASSGGGGAAAPRGAVRTEAVPGARSGGGGSTVAAAQAPAPRPAPEAPAAPARAPSRPVGAGRTAAAAPVRSASPPAARAQAPARPQAPAARPPAPARPAPATAERPGTPARPPAAATRPMTPGAASEREGTSVRAPVGGGGAAGTAGGTRPMDVAARTAPPARPSAPTRPPAPPSTAPRPPRAAAEERPARPAPPSAAARPAAARPSAPAAARPEERATRPPAAPTRPGQPERVDAPARPAAPAPAAPGDVRQRWDAGMRAVNELKERHRRRPLPVPELRAELERLRDAHGFRTLSLASSGSRWAIQAEMNPRQNIPLVGGQAIHCAGVDFVAYDHGNGDVTLAQLNESVVLARSESVGRKVEAIVRLVYGDAAVQALPSIRVGRDGIPWDRMPQNLQMALWILRRLGLVGPQMLISFAQTGPNPPEEHLANLESAGGGRVINPSGALRRPVGEEMRARIVEHGQAHRREAGTAVEDPSQARAASVLSSIALVFREDRAGQYTASRSGTAPETEMLIRRGARWEPGPVIPLGIVEVNDVGVVIRIVREMTMPRAQLIAAMREAGWRVADNLG